MGMPTTFTAATTAHSQTEQHLHLARLAWVLISKHLRQVFRFHILRPFSQAPILLKRGLNRWLSRPWVNGPYIRPSLRNRAMVWRTLRLGRSRYWWRGTSRRGYLFFLRLTARGSLRPGRSGTRSAASVASNLVHSCRRFFLVRAWLIAWVNWRRASRVPLKLIRANGTVCSVAAWAMV